MTLSNNAIKFLQAQYRAIFKRAYIKGLATAVLLTAGLAAGQAQAAWPTQVPTGATTITFVTDQSNQGSNSLAEGTVLSGTASGDTTSNKTYSVANSVGGDDSTLTNSADIYLTLSSGNTQVINAINGDVVNEGNIYLQSSGNNGKWWQAYALFNVGTDGNAISNTLTNTGTIDVTDAIAMAFSSTGAGSLVNEGTLNVTASESGGAVGLDMASSSLNSADNSLINHGTINTSGSGAYGIRVTDGTSAGSVYNDDSITGNGVSVAVIDYDDGSTQGITVTLADGSNIESMKISDGNSIVFRNNTDELVFETVESSGTNVDSTLTLENSKITFNKGTSGSVFSEINLDADSQLTNNTEMTFTGSELTLSAEQFKGLFSSETGKLTISGTGTTAVTIDGEQNWDLTSNSGGLGTLEADGTLSPSGDFLISGEKKVTFKADEITLGSAFKTDKLSLDAGTLNIDGNDEDKNKFIFSSGTITVRDALNGAAATDRVVIKAEAGGSSATLNLTAAEQGKVTHIDRFNVGWFSKASGTSTLSVEGTWDFGGARVTASNNGHIDINGDVSNVSELMLEKNGAVTVNGNLTIERLLAGEDNNVNSSLELNGKLTVVGDNREGGDKGVNNYYNDVSLTKSTVTINNGGTLAITTKDALDDFLKVDKDSGVITGITVSASGGKTNDIGGWDKNKVTLNAGGTLQLDLSTLGETSLSSTALKSLKDNLVKDGYKGSFDFGDGFKVDLSPDEQDAITNDDGTLDYSALKTNGINDVQGVASGETVKVTSQQASDGINLSNGASAVKLASGTTSVAVDGTLALNGNGSNFVYAENTPDAPADVSVKANSGVNLTGNGTVGSLTKENGVSNTTAYLTHDQSDVQTVQGKIDLDEVTIGAGSVNVTQSVTAGELTVNGNLNVSGGAGAITITGTGDSVATIAGSVQAGAISSSGGMDVTGTILAESISLAANKNLTVGDASNSGLVEVETLDLNDGMLLIDPDWTQNASFVSVKGNVNTPDVINVNGSIGVGRNSVGVFGATTNEAQESLNRLGLLQSGKLDENGIGAVLYLGNSLAVGNENDVLVDKTMDNAALNSAITGMTTNSGSVTLAAGSALVISESFSNDLVDPSQNKAIFEFAAAAGSTVTVSAESGAEIIFDSADILGGDTVTVANSSGASITTTLDQADISAAGGLLDGTANGNTITFGLAQNAADHLYNQSNPIRDMTLDVVGNQNGAYDAADAGVSYIGAMNAHNGGADIERTARMALYGGAVQATLMAQQTSTDAISERLGMANPNSALIASNNAQGGGLWLSPVYKNHDSDEFEAEGVNYGADIDLYGLALGADFTTESGVRVGAMFNVGSGDAEGQGIGEGVSNDFDYYGFSLYAGVTFGNFAVTADAGFTQVSNDLEQAVNYHGVGTLKADTDTQTVSVGVRGEYLFATPWVDVVPHVGVRYTSFDMDSYQAQVDGYTIANADADSMQVFSIPFGVTFSKELAMGNWVVKPVFDLNLTANAGDDELDSDVSFVGVPSVALSTEVLDSFTYGATLGIDAKFQESFSFGLNVGYTGSSSADEFGVNANARYTF